MKTAYDYYMESFLDENVTTFVVSPKTSRVPEKLDAYIYVPEIEEYKTYSHDRLISTRERWKKYGKGDSEKVNVWEVVFLGWITLLTTFNIIMFFYGN